MLEAGKINELVRVIGSSYTSGQKINYLKYRFSAKKEILNYDPIEISIVATGRCTLGCDMCPTHSRIIPPDYTYSQQPVKDMSLELFKKVTDKFSNAITVQIIGAGEPLLNKDFFEMVEYAACKKRMIVKTFSNGTTIREHIERLIISSLHGITISLNGYNPEEFHRMTGMPQNVYPQIYKSIKRLVKRRNETNSGLKVKLSFIIDQQNYIFAPAMIKVGADLAVDHIFFCNFLPAPFSGFTSDERCLFSNDKKIINFLKKSVPCNMKDRVTLPALISEDTAEKRCDCHFKQIRVDGDGNSSSCSIMLLNMNGNGHILNNGVWNNRFFRNMRKRFIDREAKLETPCYFCTNNFASYPW